MGVIKRFSFLTSGRPLLHIDLPGDELDIYCPTKGALEKFLESYDRLIDAMEKIVNGGELSASEDERAILDAYEWTAELMSYNAQNKKITAEDLIGKYSVSGEGLVAFLSAYTDFITEIQNSKN